MNQSPSSAAIFAALAKAQAAAKPAVFNKTNPHFKSKYADLSSIFDAIREPFAAQGIAIIQGVTVDQALVSVETMLAHGASGEWISSTITLSAASADPQKVASAVTYGRRISAASMCGVVADEDDDGNVASEGHSGHAPAPRSEPRQESRPQKLSDYDPEMKFGKAAGKRLSELDESELRWYLAVWREDLENPAKSKFHSYCRKNIAAAEALLAGNAPKQETPPAEGRRENPPHVVHAWEVAKRLYPDAAERDAKWKAALQDRIGARPSHTMSEDEALDVEAILSAVHPHGDHGQIDVPF